jgi:asparagine synthase (glutamine-hydrolysing)
MCGIWALINPKKQTIDHHQLYQNFYQLTHRGPDHSTFQTYDTAILGFHRLAIIDDTFSSNQPFMLEDDQRTILFICNGEIYNFREVVERQYLPHVKNDCMVIPELYMKLAKSDRLYDFKHIVSHSIKGEFAFVLCEFDHLKNLRKVIACRDKIGIRPMYVNHDDDLLLFSSEIKGMLAYKGSMKEFPPGTMRTIRFNELGDSEIENFTFPSIRSLTDTRDPSEKDLLSRVRKSVIQSVRRRLASDKPIAWLLSGGVDSSLVAALSAKILGKPIRTFCCGMAEGTDLKYARNVAKHIGSQHTEVFFTPEEGLSAIRDVIRTIESWDTTSVRASVGQYIVSHYIRHQSDCKVVMVGEGPDEVCSSYLFNWYAPDGEQLDRSAREYVKNIHYYDVKRADRCIARWGLEGRVPLLDPEFIEAYWTIPGEMRMPTYKKMEKWWLREAFANTGLLPNEVLWRKKEAFSDGVSGEKSWFQIIQEWVEDKVSDNELLQASITYPYCTPQTKEAFYYRKVFCEIFGEHRQEVIPGYWQPKWSANGQEVTGYIDPSARVLEVYDDPASELKSSTQSEDLTEILTRSVILNMVDETPSVRV